MNGLFPFGRKVQKLADVSVMKGDIAKKEEVLDVMKQATRSAALLRGDYFRELGRISGCFVIPIWSGVYGSYI